MKIVGLTGSIGMGKSTTAGLFAAEGVPVYDADTAVHAIYQRGGAAVESVGAAFPGVVRDGGIDRAALSAQVTGDPEKLRALEAIVHPLLAEGRAAFFRAAELAGADMIVLDIPLLFETGGDGAFDAVVVVSAPAEVQRERVLARPGMTEEKFAAIVARQTPDAEKRARADFVIDTSRGVDAARDDVRRVLSTLQDPAWRSVRRRPLDGSGEQPD
ncbi:MAG TPA: dephospho-CoA kinase [Caulobacteraceae bacterium]